MNSSTPLPVPATPADHKTDPPANLPRVRLTITPSEYALLKPGLDLIACQLANAKLGFRTHQHPLDKIDPKVSDIYKRKQYSEEGDRAVISIRAKLWELTSSRKIRANLLELSAAALALRLLRRLPRSDNHPKAVKGLDAKLERYRKQAKRAAISNIGAEQQAAAADRWRCFVQWVRYYLVYLHQPKRRSSVVRQIWSYQRSSLAKLIADMLSDFGWAPLSDLEVKRVARLMKEELRRGRHSVTLMELLRSTDSAHRAFLFGVVAKKCRLSPTPQVRYPLWAAAAERAKKFREMDLRAKQCSPELSPAPTHTGPDRQDSDLPPGSEEAPRKQLSLPEAVADWFPEQVDPTQWNHVINSAVSTLLLNPPQHVTVPPAKSLADLISKTRPTDLPGSCCYSGHVRAFANWLLRWLYGSQGHHQQVAGIVIAGYRLAIRHLEAHAA